MRERARVKHHGQPLVTSLVHPGDELPLVLGLPDLGVQAELLAGRLAQGHQVRVRRRAVHGRLALAEPAEVRPVEHEYPPAMLAHVATASYASVSRDSGGLVRMIGLPTPSRITIRSRSPRDFLSRLITSRSPGQDARGYDTGSPTEVSSSRCIATSAAVRWPASLATSAANTMPIATASPCRNR